MKHLEDIACGLVMIAATLTVGSSLAIGQPESAPQQPVSKTSSKSARPATGDRGQQVFKQNCARCHSAPEGLSPGASGAVAKHMRVRASLSEADYKALLHFLNP